MIGTVCLLAGFTTSYGLFGIIYNQATSAKPAPVSGIVLSAQSASSETVNNPDTAGNIQNPEYSPNISTPQYNETGLTACQTISYSNTPAIDLSSVGEGFTSLVDTPVYYRPPAGQSLSQIYNNVGACAKQQSGLNGYHGATSYTLKWAYTTAKLENGVCKINNLKVAVRISQLLPYIEPSALPEELKSTWQQRMTQLTAHENEHLAIDESNARHLYNQLNSLKSDCSDITAKAEAYISEAKRLTSSANQALDSISAHGTR